MSFPYKNPISPIQLLGQQSLDRSKTYGTSYSILSTGGYMEVFSLNELYYTIPPSTFGLIEFSGNTIPITLSKGSGTTFSLDTLTLHPDNISSGRRKLGMMVYVYEENQLYQFIINNYETLWNNATGSTGTTIISDFGTTIKADSPENITFINSWTANTIDGVSGETYSTAVWKKLPISGGGGGSGITGGTFDSNTGTLTLGSTGGTITITGFTDTYTTGGTFNNITNSLELYDNSGNTIIVSGFTSNFTGNTSASCVTDLYVTNIYGCSPINLNNELNLGTNNITSAGTINGVTIQTHTTRHQFGGADTIGSITPLANAIPYADINGTLDNWVSTASTMTLGKVQLSSPPLLVSNPIVVSTTDIGFNNSITGLSYSSNTLTITNVSGGTSSTTIGLINKSNTINGSSFTGNPKTFDVVFVTSYPNTNYSIQITGGVNRVFTYENKTTIGFRINSNANLAFTENVDWLIVGYGES